jgi:hypothetical protein
VLILRLKAVAFFNTVVKLFKTLPTYQWLEDAGITPSSSTTHTLASLTAAIKKGYGVRADFLFYVNWLTTVQVYSGS